MTEDEARQRWCPFVRVTVTPNDASWQGNMLTNRGDIPASSANTLCIASDCMAWRWNKNTVSGSLRTPRASGCPEPKGHCGLAGPK